MNGFITSAMIFLVACGLLESAVWAPFYEWGMEIAARNECKSVRCLTTRWHLFEAKCGVPQRVLDEMKQSKHWAEYAMVTRDCEHPSALYKW